MTSDPLDDVCDGDGAQPFAGRFAHVLADVGHPVDGEGGGDVLAVLEQPQQVAVHGTVAPRTPAPLST